MNSLGLAKVGWWRCEEEVYSRLLCVALALHVEIYAISVGCELRCARLVHCLGHVRSHRGSPMAFRAEMDSRHALMTREEVSWKRYLDGIEPRH